VQSQHLVSVIIWEHVRNGGGLELVFASVHLLQVLPLPRLFELGNPIDQEIPQIVLLHLETEGCFGLVNLGRGAKVGSGGPLKAQVLLLLVLVLEVVAPPLHGLLVHDLVPVQVPLTRVGLGHPTHLLHGLFLLLEKVLHRVESVSDLGLCLGQFSVD
jgi:hypothetical protein